MATTSIPSNGDTILSEIYIDAPPELVFEAIVDPELVVKWWEARGQDRAFSVHSLNVIYAPAESGGAPESMSRTPLRSIWRVRRSRSASSFGADLGGKQDCSGADDSPMGVAAERPRHPG